MLMLNFSLGAQTLSDTSIVYSQIKKFYFEGLHDTTGIPMPKVTQKKVLDSSLTEFGLFIFQIHTSNDKPRLYLRNFGSNKIEIIRKYDLESLFPELLRFFKVNSASISYTQQLQCLKKVIELMEQRNR
jgi:hypothetical protein